MGRWDNGTLGRFADQLRHFLMQTMALSDTNYGTLYNLTKRTPRNVIVLHKTFGSLVII